MRKMALKFPTWCSVCRKSLGVGEQALGSKLPDGKWAFRCMQCKGDVAEFKEDLFALEEALRAVPKNPPEKPRVETLEEYLDRLRVGAKWRIA